MSPECLYWIALAVLVLPSAPFNRTAIAVLLVWAFGHFSYVVGPYGNVAYMFAQIIAFGGSLSLSQPWDGSRKAYANGAVAALFVPASLLSAIQAIYFTDTPPDMETYRWQIATYWMGWTIIMAQAILVPFGNDWEAVNKTARRADEWIMAQIVKRFGGAL